MTRHSRWRGQMICQQQNWHTCARDSISLGLLCLQCLCIFHSINWMHKYIEISLVPYILHVFKLDLTSIEKPSSFSKPCV